MPLGHMLRRLRVELLENRKMVGHEQMEHTSFGGQWTLEKLDILERYLDAYTTALKSKPFNLIYIDAFAGSGSINLSTDIKNFIKGSADRAVEIDDKPFDQIIFVENNQDRCRELENLKSNNLDRDIQIQNLDANQFLGSFQQDWAQCRGVLFLDPFATEVEWSTIKRIAGFNALDTWILFPISAITRMLPRSKKPDDISSQWVQRLGKVFGDESWRELYRENPQQDMFGHIGHERDPGVNGLLAIYKRNLEQLFGNRFLNKSRTLKNSKNSALFEFLFCVGNPNGVPVAKGIASHILRKI